MEIAVGDMIIRNEDLTNESGRTETLKARLHRRIYSVANLLKLLHFRPSAGDLNLTLEYYLYTFISHPVV